MLARKPSFVYNHQFALLWGQDDNDDDEGLSRSKWANRHTLSFTTPFIPHWVSWASTWRGRTKTQRRARAFGLSSQPCPQGELSNTRREGSSVIVKWESWWEREGSCLWVRKHGTLPIRQNKGLVFLFTYLFSINSSAFLGVSQRLKDLWGWTDKSFKANEHIRGREIRRVRRKRRKGRKGGRYLPPSR